MGDLRSRFWAKVNKDGPVHHALGTRCWEWTGARNKGRGGVAAYGVMSARDTVGERLAHRVSWVLENGPTSLCVLHRCDNRACVRPEHLFVGTYSDNNRDMVAKKRHGSMVTEGFNAGQASPNAKITGPQACEIVARHAAGESQTSIGTAYGITQSAVWRIVRGKNWAHTTGVTST